MRHPIVDCEACLLVRLWNSLHFVRLSLVCWAQVCKNFHLQLVEYVAVATARFGSLAIQLSITSATSASIIKLNSSGVMVE